MKHNIMHYTHIPKDPWPRTGYIWNWDLYTGRGEGAHTDSLATRIVLQLVHDLPQSEYHL